MKKTLDRAFESVAGHSWAQATEFERTHIKSLAHVAGGIALMGYGLAVHKLAPGIGGDILAIPPAAYGVDMLSKGGADAAMNMLKN